MQSSRSLPDANTTHIISQWLSLMMLGQQESIDRGDDTTCSRICHFISLWFISVACFHSGIVMIGWASASVMGVGRLSWALRGVGMILLPDAELDTMWQFHSAAAVAPGAVVLQLSVPGVAAGVLIHRCCVAAGMEFKCWVITVTRELFREDEGVELRPRMVVAVVRCPVSWISLLT